MAAIDASGRSGRAAIAEDEVWVVEAFCDVGVHSNFNKFVGQPEALDKDGPSG